MTTGNETSTEEAKRGEEVAACTQCDRPIDGETDTMRECRDCGMKVCADCSRECGCGNIVCEACANECHECGTALCDRCAYQCEQCEHTLCEDCSRWCEGCGDRLCPDCTQICDECDERYCDGCINDHGCRDEQEPVYRDPYAGRPARDPFTFGLEIEIDGHHDRDPLKCSTLIAGWCPDGSLDDEGLEYQTHPMTMRDLEAVTRLTAGIDPDGGNTNAGGHMHLSRTSRQTPSRWYWALSALDRTQAERLNMRHLTCDRWCRLEHGDYEGKGTAINDSHARTIEFRTFGPWWRQTADRLTPAVTYMHTMWRFFQHHPLYSLKRADIRRTSVTAYRDAVSATSTVREAA